MQFDPHALQLLGDRPGRIKDLPGFKRHHRLPQEDSPAAQDFVQEIGQPSLRDRSERLFQCLRQEMGYKRKDLLLTQEREFCRLDSPHFALCLSLQILPGDCSRFRENWELTFAQSPPPELLSSLDSLLEPFFDRLCFASSPALDIESLVDLLEASPRLPFGLEYPSDCSSLSLVFLQPGWEVRLKPLEFWLHLAKAGVPSRLLTAFETTRQALLAQGGPWPPFLQNPF